MISIRNIFKSFGDNAVLRGLSLDIPPGETMTIIGGSGSGKSVLIKHIIGLLKPDSGEIFIEGVDIIHIAETQLFQIISKFGMVFQGGALFDSMTVGENVAFGIDKQLPEETIQQIVEHSLSEVGLPNIGNMLPAELSGGMKKRVAIARAIAKSPKFIMFDEPTTGLDPIMADIVNELIIKVSRHPDVTTIVITHDMVSAYKISDRIAMLYNGQIVETGLPEEIRQSANQIVRQFIEGRAVGPIKVG